MYVVRKFFINNLWSIYRPLQEPTDLEFSQSLALSVSEKGNTSNIRLPTPS